MTNSSTKKSAAKKNVAKKAPSKKKVSKKGSQKKASIKKQASARRAPKKKVEKKTPAVRENLITLKSVLAINDAKTMSGELHQKLDANKNITIDAASVEMVDTAILQLLLSFVRKLRANGLTVSWNNPSKELVNRVEMLNLTDLLVAPEVAA